jgi:hypothetical protein
MPRISKPKASKKVSKVSSAKNQEGAGTVTMGDVSGPATWASGEGWLEIVFDTLKLSPDNRRDLERYRSSSRPIDVQLPGDEHAVSCVVIGFERNPKAAFYLTKAGKR